MSDDRVPALRARLAVTDAAAPAAPGDERVYDAALVQAVEAFQSRHGLDVDGVVGRATVVALNVPVEDGGSASFLGRFCIAGKRRTKMLRSGLMSAAIGVALFTGSAAYAAGEDEGISPVEYVIDQLDSGMDLTMTICPADEPSKDACTTLRRSEIEELIAIIRASGRQ